MVGLKVTTNFEFLLDNFKFDSPDKIGFVFEGGSGSAKTYDIIQFLIYYCSENENKGKDILIFRRTYADLKKTVLKDFIKILKMYNMYDINSHTRSNPQAYNLYGNTIFFTGLDGMGSHGERHDIIWGNEAMELDFADFQQLNQRCNEMFILDYNPSFTVHWIYNNIIPREDVFFKKSTQLDNPFLPDGQRKEILSYEPYESGSYYVKDNTIFCKHNDQPLTSDNLPPPNEKNIKNGTADEFMWKVYMLGLRGANKGIIFQHVEYIDLFPPIDYVYGLDFGFTTDPTVLVRYAEDGNNIYLECLSYAPIETATDLESYFYSIGIEKNKPITADSSDRYISENNGTIEMVTDLANRGWSISKVKKTQSVMFWLMEMKKKKIHIVKNSFYQQAKIEQENYRMREINGIAINQPLDKFNHFWDASRYAHMSCNDFTKNMNFSINY